MGPTVKHPGVKPWTRIHTGPANAAIRDNWDRTFGKRKPKAPLPGAKGCLEWAETYGAAPTLVCGEHRRGRDCEAHGPKPRAPWEPAR